MLFPIIMGDPNDFQHVVQPNNIVCIPFSVDGDAVEITLVQSAPTQDHSLRAWVSVTPNGLPVTNQPGARTWHPNRIPDERVLIVDAAIPQPEHRMPVPVPAGSYHLNVHNLCSAENSFSIALTKIPA